MLKAKHAWQARKDTVESCKTDYGAALQTFNKEQEDHYTVHMPKLFQVCFYCFDYARMLILIMSIVRP